MKPRFTVEVTNHYWQCGDGCCSDSGCSLSCYDNQCEVWIMPETDWEHNRQWGHQLEVALERMMDIIGDVPERYTHYELLFSVKPHDGDISIGSEKDFDWRR